MDGTTPHVSMEEPLKFKPSLLTRVFMEGGAKMVQPSVASGITQESASSALALVYLWVLILMISMYMGAKIIGSSTLVSAFFKEDNPNADFDNPEVIFKFRYMLMIRYTLVYVLMVVCIHLLILAIFYVFIAMFTAATANDMSHIGSDINKAFAAKFWNFEGGNMSMYVYALGFVLFGVLAFQMVYFAASRSYFSYMAYPDYVDKEKSSAEEHNTPMKYILNYSIIIFSTMMFLIGLFVMHNYTKPFSAGALLFNLLTILIFATTYNLLIGFELEKKYLPVLTLFTLIVSISGGLLFLL